MNNDGAYIVRMSFKGGYFLGGVVIVNSDLKIVGTANDPVLTSYEPTSPYRDVGELKGFYNCLTSSKNSVRYRTIFPPYLRFVRPYVYMTWRIPS